MWKYLRIAVTAVSLLVCVLLIGLWVRSYSYREFINVPLGNSKYVDLISSKGVLYAMFFNRRMIGSPRPWTYHISESRFPKIAQPKFKWNYRLIDKSSTPKLILLEVRAPYWFYLMIAATFTAVPWIKWRFSLRTLLIVMTLLCVLFGMIAMSM